MYPGNAPASTSTARRITREIESCLLAPALSTDFTVVTVDFTVVTVVVVFVVGAAFVVTTVVVVGALVVVAVISFVVVAVADGALVVVAVASAVLVVSFDVVSSPPSLVPADGLAVVVAVVDVVVQASLCPVNLNVYTLLSPEQYSSQQTLSCTVVGPHAGYLIVV